MEERRLEGFSAEEIEDFRDQLGDIWLQMSILLGHKHPDGGDTIPADPVGRIYARRYRRTLARFIVRRPRGLRFPRSAGVAD
ncbi:hypothetical protein [Streptomyces sp. NBC_00046]|uniref:hypothetical protein n=1 Tax=unclassified Streptomyces TaxID=2593676 RepID=UPI00324374FD